MLSGRRGDKPVAAGSFSLETNKKQILGADYPETASGRGSQVPITAKSSSGDRHKVFKQRSALRFAQDDTAEGFFCRLLEMVPKYQYPLIICSGDDTPDRAIENEIAAMEKHLGSDCGSAAGRRSRRQ
jgi:hypothetical protein